MNWYYFLGFFAVFINALNYYNFIRSLRRIEDDFDCAVERIVELQRVVDEINDKFINVEIGRRTRWDISRKLSFRSAHEAKLFFDSVLKLNSSSPVKEPPSEFS